MKYNIIQGFNILASTATIFFVAASSCSGQGITTSSYGVAVINSVATYRQTVQDSSFKKMVDLRTFIPHIVLDLRYATLNNFMKQRMYPANTQTTYLRMPAAQALARVQRELNAQGLGMKIFDAYRPYAVTVKFWELVHDDRYVANPTKGSGHNRGIAVDLTIIDLASNKELNMGTGFDNFTDSAHRDFVNLPDDVSRNRKLLDQTMIKNGFIPFKTEWWHFSLTNEQRYEVLDLSFQDLANLPSP
jgi:zinc D-Ala-D-Ala dipeptidase